MEKISIIVPIYNVEKYLEKCVKSIITQTYKNLEIILVDDGSKDNSGKIADELSKTDSRIKVIHKENGGLSSARNEGIKYVTGEYIAFLDSDDCIIPTFYEYLYDLIIKYNADIAQGYFLRIQDELIDEVNSIIDEANSKITVEEKVLTNKEALNILYGIKELPYIQEVVVWNKLYKKDVLNNIIFPVGKLHEDEFTTHKILYNAPKIVVSNKFIHGYMQTKNSIMRKEIKLSRVKDCLGASLNSIEFFKDKEADLEYKICLRYLENCIELSGKIQKEESNEKVEKLQYIKKEFKQFYNQKIELIEKNVNNDELEKIVLALIKRAYNDENLYNYWEELSSIIA